MTGPKGDAVKAKAGDSSPLFPRLHVNETEKAGPRAPPRNKMALYEQFTIPSHCFVPSKQIVAVPSHDRQCSATEYRYQDPVFSYHMPPTLQCTSSNERRTYSHLSHGASGSASNRGCADIESRSVLVCQSVKADQCEVLRAEGTAGGTCSSRIDAEQKTFGVNDVSVVLSDCQKFNKVSEEKGPFMVGAAHDCSESSICEAFGERISIVKPSIKDRLQETFSSSETGLFSLTEAMGAHKDMKLVEQTGQSYAGEVVDEINQRYLAKQASMRLHDQLRFKNVLCMPDLEDPHCGFPSSIENKIAHRQCTDADESMVTLGEQSSSSKGSAGALNLQPLQINIHLSEASLVSSSCRSGSETAYPQRSVVAPKGAIKTGSLVPDKNRGVDVNSSTAGSLGRRRDECSMGSDNDKLESGEVLKPCHVGFEKASGSDEKDDSGLHSVPLAISFRPKDVIRAVGQQHFWKARRSILRQQRLFSEQVFELHKLIQVQHLLARTVTVLVHEDLYFGEATDLLKSEDVHAYHDSKKDQAWHPVNKVSRALPAGEISAGAEVHPAVSPLRRNTGSACMVPGGVYSSLPLLAPVGGSAWGYPSYGVGQWMGPMTVQAGPFVYQSFAGGVPYFSGAYGPTNWRPVSSVVPCSWPELPSTMQPGLGIDSTRQWQPPLYPSPVPPLATPDWYALQQHGMACSQKLESDSGPAASVASINCTRGGGSLQSTINSSVQSLQHGVDSEAVNPCARNGSPPDVCIKTNRSCRDVANVATQFKSGDVVEGLSKGSDFDCPYKPGKSGRHNSDWAVLAATGAGMALEEENMRLQLKGVAEEGTSDADHTARALNLFPLAPSMGSNYLSEGSILRFGQAVGSQGQVIKAVPRPAIAASKSAAGILLSLQQERQL